MLARPISKPGDDGCAGFHLFTNGQLDSLADA
jgi:hypothetical protein